LATFSTRAETEEFASRLGLPVEWILFDEAEFRQDQLEVQKLLEGNEP
jgi:hypothetical protein